LPSALTARGGLARGCAVCISSRAKAHETVPPVKEFHDCKVWCAAGYGARRKRRQPRRDLQTDEDQGVAARSTRAQRPYLLAAWPVRPRVPQVLRAARR